MKYLIIILLSSFAIAVTSPQSETKKPAAEQNKKQDTQETEIKQANKPKVKKSKSGLCHTEHSEHYKSCHLVI